MESKGKSINTPLTRQLSSECSPMELSHNAPHNALQDQAARPGPARPGQARPGHMKENAHLLQSALLPVRTDDALPPPQLQQESHSTSPFQVLPITIT
jgi:hypothetical protein